MMRIGLVGSTSFINSYKNGISGSKSLQVYDACSIFDALEHRPNFENLRSNCSTILFESIDSSTLSLAISVLKNGNHIIIEHADISLDEMKEIHNTSNEGNLHCTILNSAEYYKLLDYFKPEIRNPFYVEILINFEENQKNYLSENISGTLLQCMQNLLLFFNSEILQIQVKSSKIFSAKTDFIAVQLDFSNGCNVYLKLTENALPKAYWIYVYQPSSIHSINLMDDTFTLTEKNTGNLNSNQISIPAADHFQRKIQHFLDFENKATNASHSILDNYFALDLSTKILKKLNSLYD